MIKRIFVLLPGLAILLVACSSSPETPTQTALPTQTSATEVAIPLPSPTHEAEVDPPVTSELTSECTLVSSLPDTPPEYAQLFAIQDSDWSKGPADAAITIIEYSDFQ